MNINQLKYRKAQVYRLLLTVSLILSLFSISGSVGISSVQLQKTTTEFLWTGKQDVASGRGWFSSTETSAQFSEDVGVARIIEQEILLTHNRITSVQFNHNAHQFKSIKPLIIIASGFRKALTYDKPSMV